MHNKLFCKIADKQVTSFHTVTQEEGKERRLIDVGF